MVWKEDLFCQIWLLMYNWLSRQTPCPLPAGPPLIDYVVIWLGTLHIPTGDSVVYAIRQLQEIIVDIWFQESVLYHKLTIWSTHLRCTWWGWIINKCFTCKKLLQLLLRTLQRTVSEQYFGWGGNYSSLKKNYYSRIVLMKQKEILHSFFIKDHIRVLCNCNISLLLSS